MVRTAVRALLAVVPQRSVDLNLDDHSLELGGISGGGDVAGVEADG